MKIMAHLSSTMYYENMKPLVDALNSTFAILGKSKPFLTDSECETLLELEQRLDTVWQNMRKCIYFQTMIMPPKWHYVKHGIEFAVFWKMPLGFCCEESIESHHQLCTVEQCKYRNQRGPLRVKYMMNKLTLISDPLYCDHFRYAVDKELE